MSLLRPGPREPRDGEGNQRLKRSINHPIPHVTAFPARSGKLPYTSCLRRSISSTSRSSVGWAKLFMRRDCDAAQTLLFLMPANPPPPSLYHELPKTHLGLGPKTAPFSPSRQLLPLKTRVTPCGQGGICRVARGENAMHNVWFKEILIWFNK